jgi:hypothetical protein
MNSRETELHRLYVLRLLWQMHQNPPNWKRLLSLRSLLFCLVLAFVVSVRGGYVWSMIRPYYIGYLLAVAYLRLRSHAISIRNWPISDSVIDWSRVKDLVESKPAIPGGGIPASGATPIVNVDSLADWKT